MALKWLEERWAALIAALEPLGSEHEEQIRALCEAEKNWWRQRPGMKVLSSLRKPMTETRNHIREVLLVREDNWRINPKSGAKEHVALKYMNYSTEEWTQMALPDDEVLQARLAQPLFLMNPDEIVSRGERLLQMQTWPELVVGIGLNTGRSVAEILKTGIFQAKTPYSLLFAGPMTVYEQMGPFFEVPTFSRAVMVLDAVKQVRQMFGMQFAFVSRRDVGRQCGPMVRQAAYHSLGDLVPLRSGEQNLYTRLIRGVYVRLATYWYCPAGMDEVQYMATIQSYRRVLEASSEQERLTLAISASFLDYLICDPEGTVDVRTGLRLSDPEVIPLEALGQNVQDQSLCHERHG